MKRAVLGLIASAIFAISALAGEIGINFYGLSYHLNKSEAYHNAPRGWNDGQYVFNPGIGLEYDFRNKGEMGWSAIVTAGYFQDCAEFDFYFAGGGVRYRNFLFNSNRWFWDITLGGAVANAEDWTTDSNGNVISYGRETTFLPVGGIGIGYQFKNKNYLKYSFTYVPENNNIGGTSGTALIFMWITYGF